MVKGRAFTLVKENGYNEQEREKLASDMADYFNETQMLFENAESIAIREIGLFVLLQSLMIKGTVQVDLDELKRRDTKADAKRTYQEMIEVCKNHTLFHRFKAKFYPNGLTLNGIAI